MLPMLIILLFVNCLSLALIPGCTDCDFGDLGKLLFGGLAAAIGAAVIIALIKLRRQDKSNSDYISIASSKRNE